MNDQSREYPNAPGHRGVDTSMEGAEAIAPKLGKLQALTRHAIRLAGRDGVTAHELCDRLGRERTSIQPRISELRHMGRIKDSGKRRRNASGVNAIVWMCEVDDGE